jgi:hypothetical protein
MVLEMGRLPPRRAIALSVLLSAVAVAAVAALAQGSSDHDAPGGVAARVQRVALRAAAGAGDRRPTSIAYTEGTRDAANRIAGGDIVPGSQRSYLVAIRGRFVLRGVSRPMGARPPRGTVLTLVLDARIWQVTDIGLSNRYPRLGRLGAVRTVPVPGRRSP